MEAGQSCYSLSVCVGENTDPVHLEVSEFRKETVFFLSSSSSFELQFSFQLLRFVLQVLTLKHCDAALFSSSMRCMAAMGDCVIMGGSEGFLAVGVLGKSQCTFQRYHTYNT